MSTERVDRPPVVSVIVPTYNRVALLREAVQSVLAQAFTDWELIIIDDGSTDETLAYLRSCRDQRIQVVEAAHCGLPGKLRNEAAKRASGRYLAFLDSDDIWDRTKLAIQLADIARKPGARWSYTNARYVTEDGMPRALPAGMHWQAIEGWIFEQLLTWKAAIAMPTVVVERELFNEVGGFDETLRYSHDLELWLRIARRGSVAAVADPLVTVRQHDGNMWRKGGARPLETLVAIYDRLLHDPALAAVRGTCARMKVVASVNLADRYRAERHYVHGIRALLRSLPTGVRIRSWWICLGKTCLRPIIPRSIKP